MNRLFGTTNSFVAVMLEIRCNYSGAAERTLPCGAVCEKINVRKWVDIILNSVYINNGRCNVQKIIQKLSCKQLSIYITWQVVKAGRVKQCPARPEAMRRLRQPAGTARRNAIMFFYYQIVRRCFL